MSGSQLRQLLYAGLAVAGLVWTSVYLVQFVELTSGAPFSLAGFAAFDWARFVSDAGANPAARFILADVSIGVLAMAVLVVREGTRLKMRLWPLYLVLVGAIGYAFALPLFLFMRERRLAALGAA